LGSAALFLPLAAAPITVGAGVAAGAVVAVITADVADAAGGLVGPAGLVGAAEGVGLLHAARRNPAPVPAPI
jgi:hypothetical protein